MKNEFCARVLSSSHVMSDRLGHFGEDFPEEFEERLLQARLVTFWKDVQDDLQEKRKCHTTASEVYDPAVAEERYEKFRKEFLAKLPGRFALEPKTHMEWDECHPHLPLQRQMLYITIFDSICQNFKPLLLMESSHIRSLPTYKQGLVLAHMQTLALAAVNVLEAVSAFHTLIGRPYTRCPDIIFYTFEAAVILVCISITRPDALPSSTSGDEDGCAGGSNSSSRNVLLEPLGSGERRIISRERCIQATQDALGRLEMLAEVSSTAETGAHHLAQLIELGRSIDGVGAPTPASLSMEVADESTLVDYSASTISSSAQDSTLDFASDTLVNAIDVEDSDNFDLSWESCSFSQPSHFDTLLTGTT